MPPASGRAAGRPEPQPDPLGAAAPQKVPAWAEGAWRDHCGPEAAPQADRRRTIGSWGQAIHGPVERQRPFPLFAHVGELT